MQCEYRIAVIQGFEQLLSAQAVASKLIQADVSLAMHLDPLPFPALSRSTPRDTVCQLLSQFTYLDGQEGREIVWGMGAVGASDETLAAIASLNHAKQQFKLAVQTLKAQSLKLSDNWLSEQFRSLFSSARHGLTDIALQAAGLSRLHLKQCYRQIPMLTRKPKKISWTWANTRAIKKVSKSDAHALLLKKGDDPGILSQINKLESLKPHEQIAIVQTLAPHLRTNIVYEEADGSLSRHMMKGSLPVFYPAQSGEALPVLKFPQQSSERVKRSDVKIEEEVFLPAIRGHRYSRV